MSSLPQTVARLGISLINNFIIVNLHLTGGRFNDRHFENFIDTKDQHIEKLFNHLQEKLTQTNRGNDLPIIVASDFNGSPHFDGEIQRCKVYTDLPSVTEKHRFEDFTQHIMHIRTLDNLHCDQVATDQYNVRGSNAHTAMFVIIY